jgi:hypothetical protein
MSNLWLLLSISGDNSIVMVFDRALDYRSMLMFCRSMMVKGFDRDDVRSGFGFSIDIDVLSIDGGGRIRS